MTQKETALLNAERGEDPALALFGYVSRRTELPRFLAIWSAVAWICATAGMGTLVSDGVHDIAQASWDDQPLDPPIDALVGEVAFLAAAAICAALAVSCRRLQRARGGAVWQRRLRARHSAYVWVATACVLLAGLTAAID